MPVEDNFTEKNTSHTGKIGGFIVADQGALLLN